MGDLLFAPGIHSAEQPDAAPEVWRWGVVTHVPLNLSDRRQSLAVNIRPFIHSKATSRRLPDQPDDVREVRGALTREV